MKKIAIWVILFSILANLVCAQSDTGVHFMKGLSWEQVKAKAKAENKYIFVDCYASWCGPCKAMDKDVYPSEKVGNYMNQHFISLKVQMDTSRQDDADVKEFYADAHFLLQEYRINAFPSLLFFSPEGKIVDKKVGYILEGDFITVSEYAMDPDKQFYTLVEKFQQDNLDASYMKLLAQNASRLGDKELAEKIANYYIDRLSEDQLYQRENIGFMLGFTTSTKERGFAVFRDHSDKIYQADSAISKASSKAFVEEIIYNEEMKPYISSKNGKPDWEKMKKEVMKYGALGDEALKAYIPNILFKTEIEPALKIDPDWDKAFALIKKQNVRNAEEFLVGSSIVYYLNNGLGAGNSGNCKNFLGATTLYFKKYYSFLSADPLNTWAWMVFERSSDMNVLTTALIWSDSCLKMSPSPNANYYDTYANLLYKIGRTQEAIEWEEKAISIAPSDESLNKTYFKMKKGEPTWGTN
jgi:thioredoxin-related protein